MLKLAKKENIKEIKLMYSKIVEKMNEKGIDIWDDVYPCEFFGKDIEKENMYILEENSTIVGSFVLCENHSGENKVVWENKDSKAIYIDRLGVNTEYTKQGIGVKLLNSALKLAEEKEKDYLRLFVIDYNLPAIKLYEKFGFKKAEGIYTEVIDENLSFNEFGYEIKIKENRLSQRFKEN